MVDFTVHLFVRLLGLANVSSHSAGVRLIDEQWLQKSSSYVACDFDEMSSDWQGALAGHQTIACRCVLCLLMCKNGPLNFWMNFCIITRPANENFLGGHKLSNNWPRKVTVSDPTFHERSEVFICRSLYTSLYWFGLIIHIKQFLKLN